LPSVDRWREAPYPSDEAELSKTLTALAIEGAATIFFDNIGKGQTLGCPVLDALLTAPVYKARVLGVSQTVEIPFRPIVLATGNNVDLGSDTTRRVLLVRLEAQDADPSKRATWRHPDLLGWVRQERPRLHRAALTIMKAYFQAGLPGAADRGVGFLHRVVEPRAWGPRMDRRGGPREGARHHRRCRLRS
jgi:hypothetical protein